MMTGGELKEWRLKRGMTQTGLAEMLGVSLRAVQYYEKNERKIPVPVQKLIRHAETENLNVSTSSSTSGGS